ncbi:hypothetical protein F994_02769 [Acinetobacter bohemicus ANC 3994]|uniref:Uncharacterized protein n=1 Tax=Acinetobacter bohemicus ANC 3994 TaxID=1217715 RepID=N8Q9Q9_9GAMM|nr:hypothetical protein [Acinetobacter bohemicus]ENU18642.1 hypothetical protein F994_02769 [Acinetobacter bohemicus ANC 3994]
MHTPRPYGLAVEGGELTEYDKAFIHSTVVRFSNFKEASRLESLRDTYDLPNGGYCVIQDMGNVLKVIAHKTQTNPQFSFTIDGMAKAYIPMFFSGIITRARVNSSQGVKLKLTQSCIARLKQLPDVENVTKEIELQRFVIPYGENFSEFKPEYESDQIWTQYVAQNAGWYSGSMAKLMQVVGGYGRQDFDYLPNTPLERAIFQLPVSVYELIEDEINGVRLPGYTGIPPLDGKFQYDYKFSKTHAVSFDTFGKPWLVQIGSDKKVWAMPLPIIPATLSEHFKQYVEEELKDDEILEILNHFGAMPSGEGFPEDKSEFMSWVRAGVIVQVCDTSDFYNHIAYYEACGWSFNTRGGNAYNTCYNYDYTTGLAFGMTYKMSLSLVGQEDHYGLKRVSINSQELGDSEARRLIEYLQQLMAKLKDGSHRSNAILYKLRKVGNEIILKRVQQAGINIHFENEVNYWDGYTVKAAQHTGSVTQVYSGYLFHPAKFENQPQIKFPNYAQGGCLSFNFSPIETGWRVACDTIMFAYYDGDDIKVVKYFIDESLTYSKEIDTDYEECMMVGHWYKNETEGFTSIFGHFYTSDIDERDEVSQSVTKTTIEGRDQGYDSKPFFAQDSIFWRPGTLWRNRYYTHLIKTDSTSGTNLYLGVCIPMFQRACVLHATKETHVSKSYSESYGLLAAKYPYSYRYWTHDNLFAFIGGLAVQKGQPVPVAGNPVWVEIENYAPSMCSDFADQGPWIPSLPADYTWLVHPDRMVWRAQGGGGPPKVKEYSFTRSLAANTDDRVIKTMFMEQTVDVKKEGVSDGYFISSPNPIGSIFYRDACRVFMGRAEYGNIGEAVNNMRWRGGYTSLADHKSCYHFIGVINE